MKRVSRRQPQFKSRENSTAMQSVAPAASLRVKKSSSFSFQAVLHQLSVNSPFSQLVGSSSVRTTRVAEVLYVLLEAQTKTVVYGKRREAIVAWYTHTGQGYQ